MIYKALYRKLKIEQHEFHKKTGVNSYASEGYTVPAPVVASVVLLLNKNIMWYRNRVRHQST